jgi:hypothetical protein
MRASSSKIKAKLETVFIEPAQVFMVPGRHAGDRVCRGRSRVRHPYDFPASSPSSTAGRLRSLHKAICFLVRGRLVRYRHTVRRFCTRKAPAWSNAAMSGSASNTRPHFPEAPIEPMEPS